MFGGIIAQVFPEMIGKRVFRIGISFKDAAELRALRRKFREGEVAPFAEADHENALAVLRDDRFRVDDLVINVVAERLFQGVADDLKGAALIVPFEILDVLEDECGGLLVFEDVRDFKEQVALLHIFEAVLAAET